MNEEEKEDGSDINNSDLEIINNKLNPDENLPSPILERYAQYWKPGKDSPGVFSWKIVKKY